MRAIKLYIIFVCIFLSTRAVSAQSLEEYNGSYSSWANVKLRFGAKGNGKDNDTKAIQTALDELGAKNTFGTPRHFTVLYLPAGTYCISSTLIFRGKIGVSIIGENPATTFIKWVGSDADTMFWANGSAFYKISRLTWNANNRKEIEAIGIHWKDRWQNSMSQSYASLNIEISDNIFTGNCKYGISGGTNPGEGTASNDSEITIKRCLFENCYGAGLITSGYNALDYWIWDCRFLNCNIGINSRNGNFSAYRTYFKNSKQVDIANTNGYYKSVRGCYSEDSRGFVVDSGASQNPFKRIYQANTVLRQKWIPIQYYHWGRVVFLDNTFDKSVDTSLQSFIKTGSNVISVNNAFRTKTPVTFTDPWAKIRQFNDTYVSKFTANASSFLLSQEKTPGIIKRQVFEVPANADASVIQEIINNAVKLKGQKPIIHFAVGTYKVNKTLIIPAGSDIQLVGDGFLNASVILPANGLQSGTALINVIGPTNIVIRELQIGNFTNSKSTIDAIKFQNIDQQESRAFIDQIYASGNNSIRTEGLDYLYIQKDNSFFANNDFISGGPQVMAGKGTAGLFGFGGQFAGVSLQNNARVVLKDCWWEGGERLALNISGSGNLTIDGAMIAPNKLDSSLTISIKKFKGKISLLNLYLQGALEVEPNNPDLKLLLMNIHYCFTLDPFKFLDKKATYQSVFNASTAQCFINGDKRCDQIYQINDATNRVSNVDGFILPMLTDDRNSMPKKYEIKNSEASNIFISRTSLGDNNNAIRFTK